MISPVLNADEIVHCRPARRPRQLRPELHRYVAVTTSSFHHDLGKNRFQLRIAEKS